MNSEQSENIVQLKGLIGSNNLPAGLLSEGGKGVEAGAFSLQFAYAFCSHTPFYFLVVFNYFVHFLYFFDFLQLFVTLTVPSRLIV